MNTALPMTSCARSWYHGSCRRLAVTRHPAGQLSVAPVAIEPGLSPNPCEAPHERGDADLPALALGPEDVRRRHPDVLEEHPLNSASPVICGAGVR
jgi:hypothetical protein